MENAVGYIRVSTDKQDFERQRDEIVQYAKQHDFSILKIFEDKHSGSDYDERKGFQELLVFLEENPHVKIVIFDEISRMGRDTVMQVTTYKALTGKGIRIFTRGKGEFGSNKEDTILFTILSAIAEYEKQTIIDRTSSGRRKVVRDGHTQISRRPYGYNLVLTEKDNRVVIKRQSIEINEREAEVVRRMFEIVSKKGTAFDVLKELSAKKIPAPRSSKWGKSTVLRILHNPTYYGTWQFGKYVRNHKSRYSLTRRGASEIVSVSVPPIIGKGLFDSVQENLLKNKSSYNPRNSKHTFLLKGLLRCACGKIMQCYSDQRSGERVYRCPERNIAGVSEKKCPINLFKADFIEKILLQEVKQKLLDKEFLKEEKLNKLNLLERPIANLQKELDEAKEAYGSDIESLKLYYEKSIQHQGSNPEKSAVFEQLADTLLAKTKDHKSKIETLGLQIDALRNKRVDFSSFKDIGKALEYITKIEAKEYDDATTEKKVKLAREYLKGISVAYLSEETDKLRENILKLKNGLYRKGNEGLKKIYFTVANKEHGIRRNAACIVEFSVNFANNYEISVKFPYLHEAPSLLESYQKPGSGVTLIKPDYGLTKGKTRGMVAV